MGIRAPIRVKGEQDLLRLQGPARPAGLAPQSHPRHGKGQHATQDRGHIALQFALRQPDSVTTWPYTVAHAPAPLGPGRHVWLN